MKSSLTKLLAMSAMISAMEPYHRYNTRDDSNISVATTHKLTMEELQTQKVIVLQKIGKSKPKKHSSRKQRRKKN